MNRILLFSFLSLFLIHCRGKQQAASADPLQSLEGLPTIGEDGKELFGVFLVRFSNDTAFQLSRINFPLKVIPARSFGTKTQPVLWEKEQWIVQKDATNDTTAVIQRLQALSDTWISEHLYFDKMFYMRRDFVLDTKLNQWMLDQYTDMQELIRIQRLDHPAALVIDENGIPLNMPDDSTMSTGSSTITIGN